MASKLPPEDEGPVPDGHGPVFHEAVPTGEEARPAAPRWTYGVFVVVGGLTATAVATVLAPVTGVVGTVVGAYFGIQAGSAGTAAAQAAANEAHATALEAMRNMAAITAMTPAASAEQIHEILGVEAKATRTGF